MGGAASRGCCELGVEQADTASTVQALPAMHEASANELLGNSPVMEPEADGRGLLFNSSFSETKVRTQSAMSLPGEAKNTESLEELLARLEHDIEDVEGQYRFARMQAKGTKEKNALERTDEAISRIIQQLRHVQGIGAGRHETWQGPKGHKNKEQTNWTQMFEGKHTLFRSFRQVARKVQLENRVIGHWKQETTRSRDLSEQRRIQKKIREAETVGSRTVEEVNSWFSLDVFELENSTEKPLTRIFMSIWLDRKFYDLCRVTKEKALEYITALESTYKNNPYHNRIHAADVTATSYYLLSTFSELEGMEGYVRDIDVLALMLAASCHDVAHPAVNNDFLARTGHPLALRYNDRSILEHFHVATAFELMRELNIDMLSHNLLSPPSSAVRSRIIDMVLATDMAHHKAVYEELANELSGNKNHMQDVSKISLEKNILHCSDIGHPLRPFHLHLRWSERINEEFLAQGDQEKLQGIEPISLFDRDKAPPLPKGQLGFINFVVLPAWKPLREALGNAAAWPEECLQANIKKWNELAKESEAETPVSPTIDDIVGKQSRHQPAVKYGADGALQEGSTSERHNAI